jgi:2-keto-4-pentenoate hydratase
MKPTEMHPPAQIQQWAKRQLTDYDSQRPGSLFAEGLCLSVEEGYQLQTAVAQLRVQRGDAIIGYKVGCTSTKIRTQLGISHCVTGRLYEPERYQSGVELCRSGYASLAIEGELAVSLSREPTDEDLTQDGIPACIAKVFPVIELHNQVMHGDPPSAAQLIANNAIHAGFVASEGSSNHPLDRSPTLSIHIDGNCVETCQGPTLIQTIRSSLQWLRGSLKEQGETLGNGQIILTGSILSLIPVHEDCHIQVLAPPFGMVEARFRL